jgi:hypothetical protein
VTPEHRALKAPRGPSACRACQSVWTALYLVRQNRPVKIQSAWIVRIGEDLPRLKSCYVL